MENGNVMSVLKRQNSLSRIPVSSRGRSTISKFLESPFSAKKDFRSRSLSASGRASARLHFQSPKPKLEKTKSEALSIVIKFLTEKQFPLPFKSNSLPTLKDFRDVCVFLVEMIDPKKARLLQSSKDFESDFINFLSILGYTKKINRTAMRTVNTKHGWLALLPVLLWLVKFIELLQLEIDTPSAEEFLDDEEKFTKISQKLVCDILVGRDGGKDVENLKSDLLTYAGKIFKIDSDELDSLVRSSKEDQEKLIKARKTALALKEEEQRFREAYMQKERRAEALESEISCLEEDKIKLNARYEYLTTKMNQNEEEVQLQKALEQLMEEHTNLLGTHGKFINLEYVVQNLELEEAQLLKDYENVAKKQGQVMQQQIAKKKQVVDIVNKCNEALINMNLFEGLKLSLVDEEMKVNWDKCMEVVAKLEERIALLVSELRDKSVQEKELIELHRNEEDGILRLSSQKTLLNQEVASLTKSFQDVRSESLNSITTVKAVIKQLYSELMQVEEIEKAIQHLQPRLEAEKKSFDLMLMKNIDNLNMAVDDAVAEKQQFQERMSQVYEHYENQLEQLQEVDLNELREALGVQV